MRVACPCCYALHELDALVADVDARRALARLADCGGALTSAAVAYLGCFRPKQRVLSWARFTRLLDELAAAVEAGSIRRKGRDWTVTREQWVEALHIVVGRRDAGALELPLKNHAYLYEVAAGLADKAEAAAEREVEAARRNRAPRPAPAEGGAQHIAEHVSGYRQMLDEAQRLGIATDVDGTPLKAWELAEAIQQAKGGKTCSS